MRFSYQKEKTMINNFNVLNPLISFEYPEPVVYQVQIIQRRKENPDLRNNAKTIRQFYLYSENDLSDLMPKITALCDEKNARAYLNVEAKSLKDIAHAVVDLTNEYIRVNQLNAVQNVFQKAYGGGKDGKKIKILGPKRWVIDCDDVTIEYVQEVFEKIWDWHKQHKTNAEFPKLVDTPNGWHIITQGFHPDVVSNYSVEIKKNAPTILYAPTN